MQMFYQEELTSEKGNENNLTFTHNILLPLFSAAAVRSNQAERPKLTSYIRIFMRSSDSTIVLRRKPRNKEKQKVQPSSKNEQDAVAKPARTASQVDLIAYEFLSE